MNQLGITCFMLVVINTQARPGGENQNDLSGQGTADKRWIQGGSSFGVNCYKIGVYRGSIKRN